MQDIRLNARLNRRIIIDYLQNNYLQRDNGKVKARPAKQICLFCSVTTNITQEHVLPRWVFDKDPNRFFNTKINGLSHKYNRTTIPACATCNNDLLSAVENRVLHLFQQHQQMQFFFTADESADVIRWLELLDYKYQVFSLMTKFRAVKGKGQIEFLTDYSLSVLDPNIDYSPAQVMYNLREALRRISIKSKEKMLNSLVTFKSKNPDFHFFHKNNDFLFLELPKYKLALLYFYKLTFPNVSEAHEAAQKVIKQHY